MNLNQIAKQKSKFVINQNRSEMNLRIPDTELLEKDYLPSSSITDLLIRGDARDKIDDQRTTRLYLCNYGALISFFFVCRRL